MGDDLSYGLYTLGLLCLWQCFMVPNHWSNHVMVMIHRSGVVCAIMDFIDRFNITQYWEFFLLISICVITFWVLFVSNWIGEKIYLNLPRILRIQIMPAHCTVHQSCNKISFENFVEIHNFVADFFQNGLFDHTSWIKCRTRGGWGGGSCPAYFQWWHGSLLQCTEWKLWRTWAFCLDWLQIKFLFGQSWQCRKDCCPWQKLIRLVGTSAGHCTLHYGHAYVSTTLFFTSNV